MIIENITLKKENDIKRSKILEIDKEQLIEQMKKFKKILLSIPIISQIVFLLLDFRKYVSIGPLCLIFVIPRYSKMNLPVL